MRSGVEGTGEWGSEGYRYVGVWSVTGVLNVKNKCLL